MACIYIDEKGCRERERGWEIMALKEVGDDGSQSTITEETTEHEVRVPGYTRGNPGLSDIVF